MARWGTVNKAQHLHMTHWDGRTDLYPRAHIYDGTNTEIANLPLFHRALGYYSTVWTPTLEDQYAVIILTYLDSNYTQLDPETSREGETYFINSIETDIENLPSGIADQVWDEVLPGQHDDPNTSGLYMQVIRETTLQTNCEVKSDPQHSLAKLDEKILENRNLITAEVNENEAKIDALSAQNSSEYLSLQGDILQNRADISSVNSNINTSTTQIIGEINENEAKIDSVTAAISQIQNNTRFVAVVPPKMLRPQTGTKNYQFFLAIYDTVGNPEAPDVSPTVRIVQSNGTEILAETTMTQDGAKVGQYYYNYSIGAGASESVLRIEFKVTEGGVVRYLSRVSELIEFDTSLASIENKIDIIDSIVDDNNALLTGGNGLTVLSNKLDTVISEVNQNETKIDQVKLKTDLIVSNPATTTDLAFIEAKIDAKPEIVDIQARLDVQTDAIQGPGAYNLTDVMNNERGTDNALLSNDPRLDFLDATISSRSNHSTADIWSYATRTLTSAPPLTSSDVAAIWDYLTANISVNGSIGKYILDYLDAPVSSRSDLTLFQLNNALAPLALEATAQTILSTVVNEANENELKLNDIISVLDLIKPKTDLIVPDGAQQTSLENEHQITQDLITGLELLVQGIKTNTDNIPSDVARQSSLLQIPINPLLTNDARLTKLNYLDVPVSSRATDFPTDYAKEATLVNHYIDIMGNIDNNETLINNLPSESFITTGLTNIQNIIVSDLSEIKGTGFDAATDSLVEIRDNLNTGFTGGATAEEVWTYGSRELTDFPDFATNTDLDSAVNEIKDASIHYRCHMTTTFVTATDTQEVLCWLDRNGLTIPFSSNARIIVSNGISDIWSGTASTPDSRGVFRISQNSISSLINTADKNFVISMTIEYNGTDYTTTQPFYTVG